MMDPNNEDCGPLEKASSGGGSAVVVAVSQASSVICMAHHLRSKDRKTWAALT